MYSVHVQTSTLCIWTYGLVHFQGKLSRTVTGGKLSEREQRACTELSPLRTM